MYVVEEQTNDIHTSFYFHHKENAVEWFNNAVKGVKEDYHNRYGNDWDSYTGHNCFSADYYKLDCDYEDRECTTVQLNEIETED